MPQVTAEGWVPVPPDVADKAHEHGLLVGALAIAGMVKPHEAASKAHALRRIFARALLGRNEEAMIAGLARAAARAMGSGLPEGLR